MAKRKAKRLTNHADNHHNPSADWTREAHVRINGRYVEPGTELTIHGEGGVRFIFVQVVTTPAGKRWLDVWETEKGSAGRYRSFYPERVRTVHRLNKTRQNLAA
jgi:hypothetical protein